jgi:hypothetical protein
VFEQTMLPYLLGASEDFPLAINTADGQGEPASLDSQSKPQRPPRAPKRNGSAS